MEMDAFGAEVDDCGMPVTNESDELEDNAFDDLTQSVEKEEDFQNTDDLKEQQLQGGSQDGHDVESSDHSDSDPKTQLEDAKATSPSAELVNAAAAAEAEVMIAAEKPSINDHTEVPNTFPNTAQQVNIEQEVIPTEAPQADLTSLSSGIPSVIEKSTGNNAAMSHDSPEVLDFMRERIGDLAGFVGLKQAQKAAHSAEAKKKHKRAAEKELSSLRSKKQGRISQHGEEVNDGNESVTPLWKQNFTEIDEEGDDVQEAYRIKAERYHRKEKSGTLSQEEEMEFMALNQKERSRRKKIEQDWEIRKAEESLTCGSEEEIDRGPREDASGLFVPRSPAHNTGMDHDSHDISVADACDMLGLPSASLDDDEIQGQLRQPENAVKKKSRTKATKPRKTSTKPKKKRGLTTADIPSLLTSNPIRDAQHLEDGEEDEGRLRLTGRRKMDALKNLIASLPQEHQDVGKADKAALHKASTDFTGHGSCRVSEDGKGWMIKGMRSSLRHFQMLGAAWMRNRENSTPGRGGGLIADEMGMGKTIMTIANIVNGQPSPKKHRECKATLIVVPSSIINQWFDEIKKHANEELHGPVVRWKSSRSSGIQTSNDRKYLCGAFIVLCTYYEVTKSWTKIIFPEEVDTDLLRAAWLKENEYKYRGLVHRIPWLRVVVDEAHSIKNHLSHTSLAIRDINATYRWAITGTPIHNSPRELYSYFRFLEVPHTGDFRIFCKNYDIKTSDGQKRLLNMLNSVMLRRTYRDKLMGEALVKLPRTSSNECWVEFNTIERFVYDLIHRRIQENICNMARKGTLAHLTYHHVLTMILRLRQASSHLLLVEQSMRDLLTASDLKELQDLCDANDRPVDQRDKDSLLDLRRMMKNQEKWQAATDEAPESFMASIESDADGNELQTESTGHAYGLKYNFKNLLETLKAGSRIEELRESMSCSKCNADPADDPHLTTCSHIYCKTCIGDMLYESTAQGLPAKCRVCWSEFARSEPFDPDKPLEEQTNTEPPRRAAKSAKGKRSNKKQLPMLFEKPTVMPLCSAKSRATKAQVLNWIEINPKMKAIIFTQFVAIIEVLKKMCAAEGWACFGFCGDMSIEARSLAIEGFEKSEGPCIMIATLRTGGVGLNLTMASNVIIVDPWWNSSVEMQAFGRVFRIGQKEKTSLLRLFAKDTVDTKMHNMQETKTAAIEAIMGGKGDLNGKPTMTELIQLFGLGDKENDFILTEEQGQGKKRTLLDDNAYLQWNKDDSSRNHKRIRM